MNSAVINIRPDGTMQCLWTDNLPLHDFGELHVNRASTIEFDGDAQMWEVRMEGSNAVVFRHASRAICIAWEVETINAQLLAT